MDKNGIIIKTEQLLQRVGKQSPRFDDERLARRFQSPEYRKFYVAQSIMRELEDLAKQIDQLSTDDYQDIEDALNTCAEMLYDRAKELNPKKFPQYG